MAIQGIYSHRKDTAANYTSNNPILKDGELAVETDTGKIKFGDGTTAWDSLDYIVANSYSKDYIDTNYYTITELEDNYGPGSEITDVSWDSSTYEITITVDGIDYTGDLSHNHDASYYTQTELDGGQLDIRYYTETELDDGVLDVRYYTETEVDNNTDTLTQDVATAAGTSITNPFTGTTFNP